MARNKKGQFGKKTLEGNTLDLMTEKGKVHMLTVVNQFADLFELFNATEGMVSARLQEFCAEEGVQYNGAAYREAINAQDSRIAHLVAFEKFSQDIRQAMRKAYQLQDMLKGGE